MLLAAAGGSALSAVSLIADLKKPQRFHHMLRVFKPTSPMSVGVYLFSIFGGASMTAAASEITGIARPVGRLCEAVAAIAGPFMSVYTSVLICDTVMPAWHNGRRSMPLLFAATSAATAGGLGVMLSNAADRKPARRLALLGAVSVPIALERLRAELGPFQNQPYESGKAAHFTRLARFLNLGGAAAMLLGHRRSTLVRIAGSMLLAAGLAERLAVYHAGKQSAQDPKYTIGERAQAVASA